MSVSETRALKVHVTLGLENSVSALQQAVFEALGHWPTGEFLWAKSTPVSGVYRVDSVPYHAYGVHADDAVRCERRFLRVRGLWRSVREVVQVVQPGGSSTFRILFVRGTDRSSMNAVLTELIAMGGTPDTGFPRFMSLSVPVDEIDRFTTYLGGLRESGRLDFERA